MSTAKTLPTGEQLWRLMFDSQQLWKRLVNGRPPKRKDCRKIQAIAVLTKPLIYLTQQKSTTRPGKPATLPAGTKVRVVMASRFGDLGLSRNLKATNGYFVRVYPEEGHLQVVKLLEV